MQHDGPFPLPYRLRPAEPLWRLAPTCDQRGSASADFMMLIPRLASRGPAFFEHSAAALCRVCEAFGERILFADINRRTGVLWISVQANPGLCAEVAYAIQRELPQALTVGGQLNAFYARSGLLERLRNHAVVSRIPRLGARLRALCLPGSAAR